MTLNEDICFNNPSSDRNTTLQQVASSSSGMPPRSGVRIFVLLIPHMI